MTAQVKQTGRAYIFKMATNNYDDYDEAYYNSFLLDIIGTLFSLHITWVPGIYSLISGIQDLQVHPLGEIGI